MTKLIALIAFVPAFAFAAPSTESATQKSLNPEAEEVLIEDMNFEQEFSDEEVLGLFPNESEVETYSTQDSTQEPEVTEEENLDL